MKSEGKTYRERLAATRKRERAWCPKGCGFHLHCGTCEGKRRENDMFKALTLRFVQAEPWHSGIREHKQRTMKGSLSMRTTINVTAIPDALKALPQWVTWRMVDRNGKASKLPIDPVSSRAADPSDPKTWAAFDEALWEYRRFSRDGLGFVFSGRDPYVGVDLDHMRSDDGRVDEKAKRIILEIGSYTELSPSGRGFHIIAKARRGFPGTRRGRVDMYSAGRYFSMTGRVIKAVPPVIEERTAQLEALWTSLGGGEPRPVAESLPYAIEGASLASDKEVYDRAWDLNTRFKALYLMGDIGLYGNDHSRADCALVGMLARATRDPTQIDRLFRESALYRPKWDEVHYRDGGTYGEGIIQYVLKPSSQRRR